MNSKRNSNRSQVGNMTLMMVATMALLTGFILLGPFQWALSGIAATRHAAALEAASLTAARELSRIVYEDEYFGFLSLTDQPPLLKDTLAADDQPLPVKGINSLLASIRLQLLVADSLNNEDLRRLALDDLKEARRAANDLQELLYSSISESTGGVALAMDADGNRVDAYGSAFRAYAKALAGLPMEEIDPKQVKLNLGWLIDGGNTATPVPGPTAVSLVSHEQIIGESYRSCVNVPASRQDFFLTAVDTEPALVQARHFREPDGIHFCSVVRVEADLRLGNETSLRNAACAEPWHASDPAPAPVLLLSFPNGIPSEINSMESLLSASPVSASRPKIYTSTGGDYPADKSARLLETNLSASDTEVIAEAFHDWLRAVGSRVRVDSLIDFLRTPFRTLATNGRGSGGLERPLLFVEVDRSGNVVVTNRKRNPFINQVIHENQRYARCDTPASGQLAVSCRNLVRNLGRNNGGKHAGQPMPGNPVNWGELPYFDENERRALEMGRGKDSLGLTVTGDNQGCAGGPNAVSILSASFEAPDEATLPIQPRKSYYSGGLACEIQVVASQNRF